MQSLAILIPLAFVVGLIVSAWGLSSSRTSLLIGLIAAVIALLAGVCTWHGIGESAPWPWPLGYGLVCLTAVASCIRQSAGGRTVAR